jgi:glutathione S-transferase
MSPDSLRLYYSAASPNSRRVHIFLPEKALRVEIGADLSATLPPDWSEGHEQ